MNNIQQILRLLMPAIKGSPFIAALIGVLVFVASRIVFYATPLYECTGRVKLEDVNMGISNTNLFKDFDVFAHPNKIMAEVEVFKSPELIKFALSKIPFDVTYARIGKIRTSELFKECPFRVQYAIADEKWYGKPFQFFAKDRFHYKLTYEDQHVYEGQFAIPLSLPGIKLTICRNDSILQAKPQIQLTDQYQFTIYSKEQLVGQIFKNLDVKEFDKEVPVIRIIYKHPVPEKAALFVNTLMEAYIEDGVRFKTSAAKNTVRFIENQLEEVSSKLVQSEQELETYRLLHKVTNTRMEVETGLKKVAEMKIQLSNIEMTEASLDSIDSYVNENNPEDFLNKAPNYEGYGGLLYTELIKRLKTLQSDKKDLLLKYTPENEYIKGIDQKMQDVTLYIRQNISNARKSMHIQRDKIAKDIQEAEKDFLNVPTKEKDMVILERNFQLNQAIYNFLMEKRTEASIAQAATMSFHRVIQKADIPNDPVSPKKTFTILVFGFLGLLCGIVVVYAYDAISARIKYKDQLEKVSTCPVLGDIRHEYKKGDALPDFYALCTKLLAKSSAPQSIVVASGIDGEGKTFVVENLALAFAQMGIKTLLIGSDLRDHSLAMHFNKESYTGLVEYILEDKEASECIYPTRYTQLDILPNGNAPHLPEAIFAHFTFDNKAKALKEKYHIIVWDSPSFDTALDALGAMRNADHVLYVFRAHFSKTKLASEPDLLKSEYGFEHIKLLLNDVPSFAKMKRDRGMRKILRLTWIAISRNLKRWS